MEYKIVEIKDGFECIYYVYKKCKFLFWTYWKKQIAWFTYAGEFYEFKSLEEAKEYIKKRLIPLTIKETEYP